MRTTTDGTRSGSTNRHDSPAEEVSPIKTRLSRILAGSDFPALSQQIIDTISVLDDDASSMQRLANVVLREYSLTISVVRTANSAHYRRTGRPIQSATHAMMMLGARTVRHLASSLLLFENYSKRSDGLKELMLLSLLTANHARELATRLGTCDPEEAHLCGMFRNLGEVLVLCHFPEDYAAIQAAMADGNRSVSSATNDVLGFRYEDLGAALSQHWGMPDSVMKGMRSRASAPLTDVGAITSFSHDLTAAIYRGEASAEGAQDALDEVIERYAPRLKLSRASVTEVVEAALNETRELFVNANNTKDRSALRQLSVAARQALGGTALKTGEWDATGVPACADHVSLELRDKLRQELENKVDPASESNLGNILLLALEGALRGGPFDRVIACVLNADRTQLTARTALGVGAEALMAQFDFPMSSRGGPVAVLLMQRQSLYLPVDRSMSAQETRWATSIGCAQFGVFPIIVATKIVGCLYVDRVSPQPAPDRATHTYVKSLCDLVAKAISARRGAHASSAGDARNASGRSADGKGISPSGTTAQETPTHSASHTTPQHVPAAWSASLQASLAVGGAMNAESKGALVLRMLQGEDVAALALSTGVAAAELEQWRKEFLEGALARLS